MIDVFGATDRMVMWHTCNKDESAFESMFDAVAADVTSTYLLYKLISEKYCEETNFSARSIVHRQFFRAQCFSAILTVSHYKDANRSFGVTRYLAPGLIFFKLRDLEIPSHAMGNSFRLVI